MRLRIRSWSISWLLHLHCICLRAYQPNLTQRANERETFQNLYVKDQLPNSLGLESKPLIWRKEQAGSINNVIATNRQTNVHIVRKKHGWIFLIQMLAGKQLKTIPLFRKWHNSVSLRSLSSRTSHVHPVAQQILSILLTWPSSNGLLKAALFGLGKWFLCPWRFLESLWSASAFFSTNETSPLNWKVAATRQWSTSKFTIHNIVWSHHKPTSNQWARCKHKLARNSWSFRNSVW